MKIQVKNLGPLKEAEFEVADLTIICGGNNTGKTYATYALFGFLYTWKDLVNFDIDESIVDSLLSDKKVSISMEKYINQIQEIIDKACKAYSYQISDSLAVSPALSTEAEFRIVFDSEDEKYWKSRYYEISLKTQEPNGRLKVTKEIDSLNITVSIHMGSEYLAIPDEEYWAFINFHLKNIFFPQRFRPVFIDSVERTGICLFRREIDSARSMLLNKMSKASTSEQKLGLFNDAYQDYSLPIQFGLDFNRSISKNNRKISFIAEKYPTILNDFANIIGGEFHFNDHDNIYYSPQDNSNLQLSVSESSSSIKSLLDFGFYLRHQAMEDSFLIVDEPELNLHPENQRRIARLLARLVNIGIKVFITTHSDYIIKELNTLIMLNHDKPHLKKIAAEEGYKPEELIAAERIKVYIAENSTLVPAHIDPEMGIEARSFDTTIEDMNRIQEAIVWSEE